MAHGLLPSFLPSFPPSSFETESIPLPTDLTLDLCVLLGSAAEWVGVRRGSFLNWESEDFLEGEAARERICDEHYSVQRNR